jgi:hypothetical protein
MTPDGTPADQRPVRSAGAYDLPQKDREAEALIG